MTDREDLCDNYIATLDFADLHELSIEKLIAMGWQASTLAQQEKVEALEVELEMLRGQLELKEHQLKMCFDKCVQN